MSQGRFTYKFHDRALIAGTKNMFHGINESCVLFLCTNGNPYAGWNAVIFCGPYDYPALHQLLRDFITIPACIDEDKIRA